MVRVTPSPSRSREARPGLSRGINLRGKCRKRSAERRARPKHFQVATSASVARNCARALSGGNVWERGADNGKMRLSALRLPSFSIGEASLRAVREAKTRMQSHRENDLG